MPERRFDTGYWNDPDIMKMPTKVKLLYIYLWTNRHCNQAGLYEIALETIQWETGLGLDELPDLLQSQSLKKKVSWLPEQNLVWVKNFLRRQSQSPKFLTAAAKCLKDISNNGVVDEFISFNAERGLVIPYQYPIDRVSIPLYSDSYAYANALSSSDKGGGLGEGNELTAADQEIITVWRGVERFVMELPAMVELIKKIRADLPDVDILAESRKWEVSKLAHPLGKASNCSGQIYNFMAKRHEWNKEQKSRDHKGYPQVRCKCGYTGPDVGHTTCPLCHQPYEKGK